MVEARKVRRVDMMRLAVESHRDVRTVERVLEGKCSELTRSAIVDAAARLGIALPVGLDAPPVKTRAT